MNDTFVEKAKKAFNSVERIGIVGGLIITPMETPAQELMGVLRLRAFFNNHPVDACFLTESRFFNEGYNFSEAPHSTIGFLNQLKREEYIQERVKSPLMHLGEPESMKELLSRQCRYGLPEKYNSIYHSLFCNTFIGKYTFFIYKPYYDFYKDLGLIKTSFKDMSRLFCSFISVYYSSSKARLIEIE